MKKLSLSERMKTYYEDRSKIQLPRRTYFLIRMDGVGFSKYCKKLKRPYDEEFISDMNDTAVFLCSQIQGAKLAFVQSDEISVLLTDFDDITSQAWFDSDVQKITSISSSFATSEFNRLRIKRFLDKSDITGALNIKNAQFDSRFFSIPEREEVLNYFISRQKDCTRNSISQASQAYFSHKELNGVNSNQKQELLFSKGINWNDYPTGQKRGRVIKKEAVDIGNGVIRNKWNVDNNIPIFTKDREYLYKVVPDYKYENEK